MNHNSIANVADHNQERIVYGLGATGLSIARHLYAKGNSFCVYDCSATPPALEKLRLEMPDISFFSGEQLRTLFDTQTELFVSPGISSSDPLILKAIKCGAKVKSDIDLFVAEAKAPIIGITGSNGKTTVTEMVGQMAEESGFAVGVGGNFGPPALELLGEESELFILELSSFQLEHSGPLNLSIGAILNLSPDHLDRHASMKNYYLAKQRIFDGCHTIIVNRNDLNTHPINVRGYNIFEWGLDKPETGGVGLCGSESNLQIFFGAQKLIDAHEMPLTGRHHLMNALAALAIGISSGFSVEAMLKVLRNFSGLAHRCEVILTKDGVSWINDSKATNVGATRTALETLGGAKNIFLVAGGLNKGAKFECLRGAIKKYCKEVILLGDSSDEFSKAISDVVKVKQVDSIEEAVRISKYYSSSGDLVLLSPACSSFDMFQDYVDRGDYFRRTVFQVVDAS